MFCHIFHNNIFFFLFFSRQDGCENRNGTFSVRVESVPCCDEALTCSRAIILDLQVAGHSHFSSLKHRFFVHVFIIYLHYLNYTLTIRSVIHHFLHPIASHTTSATSFT